MALSILFCISLLSVTTSLTVAVFPMEADFIWYMYPQWKGQLYGYFPKRNISTTADKLVGVVTTQKEQGIMGVHLPQNTTGSNKIVLGNLNDTCIGNITACPTFTVSFLVKVGYPLPVGFLLSFLMSIPRRQSRSNSHAVLIGSINRGFNVSLQAGIGSHMDSSSNEVMDIGRTEPGDLSVWTHVSVVYHGGSHSEHPDLYVNGTKAITIPYEDAQDAQGSGSLLYCVGGDASPQNMSISLLSVVKGELNETQIRDLSASMFQFALQTNQVAVKLSTSNTTVQETVGSLHILAERTGNIQLASIVRFSATAGSATTPEDYTSPSSEAFIFKPGEINHIIDIPIISDDYTEDAETFTVSVTSLDGVTSTDVQSNVTITIPNHVGSLGRRDANAGDGGDDESEGTCFLLLILLSVAIGLAAIGIIILVAFYLSLFRS